MVSARELQLDLQLLQRCEPDADFKLSENHWKTITSNTFAELLTPMYNRTTLASANHGVVSFVQHDILSFLIDQNFVLLGSSDLFVGLRVLLQYTLLWSTIGRSSRK